MPHLPALSSIPKPNFKPPNCSRRLTSSSRNSVDRTKGNQENLAVSSVANFVYLTVSSVVSSTKLTVSSTARFAELTAGSAERSLRMKKSSNDYQLSNFEQKVPISELGIRDFLSNHSQT
jgi:hypothetical protein